MNDNEEFLEIEIALQIFALVTLFLRGFTFVISILIEH